MYDIYLYDVYTCACDIHIGKAAAEEMGRRDGLMHIHV